VISRPRLIKAAIALAIAVMLAGCAANPGAPDDHDQPSLPGAEITPEMHQQFDRALVLLQKERYDEAAALLELIVAKETRFAAPYVNLGIAYARRGDDKQAQEYLVQALVIEPHNVHANNELGLLHRKGGRFVEARKAYEAALEAHPEYLPARRNLGILCEIYLHDLSCARDQFAEYQKYAPEDAQVNLWVADLARRTD
jgi:tetratricopeptide (TPR) repeat protein